MRVTLLHFSASGNTDRVAHRIAERLAAAAVECQLLNIAGDRRLYPDRDFAAYLEECVEPHDLLCIGSPVYVHHLRCDLCDLLAALPDPDDRWGALAAPFVTFGGINSGVALQEASRLLQDRGRAVVAGLKVNSEHTLNRLPQMSLAINVGLPAAESHRAIDAFAARLVEALGERRPVKSVSLAYQSGWQRLKDRFMFTEVFSQRHLFPKVVIDEERCIRCGACVETCPIQRLSLGERSAQIRSDELVCTHCGSCQLVCPSGALELKGPWWVMERALVQAAEGKGMIASSETIETEVLP